MQCDLHGLHPYDPSIQEKWALELKILAVFCKKGRETVDFSSLLHRFQRKAKDRGRQGNKCHGVDRIEGMLAVGGQPVHVFGALAWTHNSDCQYGLMAIFLNARHDLPALSLQAVLRVVLGGAC